MSVSVYIKFETFKTYNTSFNACCWILRKRYMARPTGYWVVVSMSGVCACVCVTVIRVYCMCLTVCITMPGCRPSLLWLCSWATMWEIAVSQGVLFGCKTEQLPSTTTAKPFQFLPPWLSDGKTCGTENTETSAKHESWFSTRLNWFHGALTCSID